MKIVKKILFGLLAIPLVLLAVVVVVQTYYHLTSAALSTEALELNVRAEKLPVLTENGYRLYGLFAPREQDAAVFDKCLVDGYERHKREDREAGVKAPSFEDKPAWEAYEKGSAARVRALDDSCLKSGTRLTLPTALTDIRVNLSLGQFISAASADMRDVFTAKPFAYDASSKRLRIELRERSSILGDKGPYELAL